MTRRTRPGAQGFAYVCGVAGNRAFAHFSSSHSELCQQGVSAGPIDRPGGQAEPAASGRAALGLPDPSSRVMVALRHTVRTGQLVRGFMQ